MCADLGQAEQIYDSVVMFAKKNGNVFFLVASKQEIGKKPIR